ncbi:hypothetical protein C5167_038513 [Papaver somniferum]|uniref:Uncharacterized protein n=1 Tax=Papaver somniferum TaxID=3469 RepID=A0A4Y7IDI4_PAPSO|nr:uncharacterized protein LOC113296714 [Papaver somniferum]RZC45568.1 hypothetical protein C5167_038513 [Papaver somniferum]
MAAVVTQSPPPLMEFIHDSSCSTPYISAPSSPKLITHHDLYFSAPASPTSFTSIYREFNKNPSINGVSNSMVPFNWEEKPGTPKHRLKPSSEEEENEDDDDDGEFAFDFNSQFEKSSALSAADELFYGGKIRPLEPPPGIKIGFDDDRKSLVSSPRSPRSPISQGKKIIRDAFSPRQRNRDIDPFAVAMEESRKQEQEHEHEKRGRNEKRTGSNSKKTSAQRWTRSLSPFRVSDQFEEDEKQEPKVPTNSSKWSFGGYKKWRLRDLLLFRSASEGRANDKETIRKFAVLSKKEDVKSSSFRSTDSAGSTSSRRRGNVSAHELHYTMNRANSEELKRKTVLPYRQGFFGCLGFNPAANRIAKGFNL